VMNINCSEEVYYVISPIILIYVYKGKKKICICQRRFGCRTHKCFLLM
jgi:NADH pyrophosphatase NudC (nudix superfamily)